MSESYGKVLLVTDIDSLLENLKLYSGPIDELSKSRGELELQKAKLEKKVDKIAEDYIRESQKAKQELSEKDKELVEKDLELNGYFNAIQNSIDTWLELSTKKLVQRDQKYQALQNLYRDLGERDPDQIAFEEELVSLYLDLATPKQEIEKAVKKSRKEVIKKNRALNIGLELLICNREEIENLEEEISTPFSAGVIIKPIKNMTELYLSVPFVSEQTGLMKNLIDYIKSCLPNYKLDLFHHCGAVKAIVDFDDEVLYEKLSEKKPEEFEEANIHFVAINIRNVPKKKKSSQNSFLKIITGKK